MTKPLAAKERPVMVEKSQKSCPASTCDSVFRSAAAWTSKAVLKWRGKSHIFTKQTLSLPIE
jgi:hypothetical protein